ncbi:DUF6776 family protein [Chitinibacteraceae bacterium HSL-7]
MPLKRLYRMQRARLTAKPLVLQPALGWGGRLGRLMMLTLLLCGMAGAGAYFGFRHGVEETRKTQQVRASNVNELQGALDQATREGERLRQQLNMAQSAQKALANELGQAQADAAQARETLAFFDSLLTSNDRSRPVRIAACEARRNADGRLHYRVLLLQGTDRAQDASGRLTLVATFKSTHDGASRAELRNEILSFRHYRRIEGDGDIPAGAELAGVRARFDGGKPVELACDL